ncbi:hypothetical protein GN956_G21845 [Arapaima gigas]
MCQSVSRVCGCGGTGKRAPAPGSSERPTHRPPVFRRRIRRFADAAGSRPACLRTSLRGSARPSFVSRPAVGRRGAASHREPGRSSAPRGNTAREQRSFPGGVAVEGDPRTRRRPSHRALYPPWKRLKVNPTDKQPA